MGLVTIMNDNMEQYLRALDKFDKSTEQYTITKRNNGEMICSIGVRYENKYVEYHTEVERNLFDLLASAIDLKERLNITDNEQESGE